ncbi:MAG: DNA polymerase I [Lentimicrobiaceae bacterium]|jgi:DNA polymerase-1|nr:DNA polymerase I [Lentimicrobiaceae bacterium]
MSETRHKLFLLDAMALMYRAFFALNKNPRINSKGLNTSAIMGFTNTLYEVLKNEKPTHIGVAFDSKGTTFRAQEFPEYKAHRESMPDDLRASIPFIINIINAFNIPILTVEGYEADDVIGTLSKKAEKNGFITYMMTPDKDFGQLVSEHIFMYKPAQKGDDAVVWGTKEVCDHYGIEKPEQLIDILGLWGDASDNIPGVPGIGKKTATKLIAEYGSVENLLQHTPELSGKLRENIETYAEQGLQSKKLATIDLNVPIEFDAEALKLVEPNMEKLQELFEELEFKTLFKRISDDLRKRTQPAKTVDLFSDLEEETSFENTLFSNKASIETTLHEYVLVKELFEIEQLVDVLQQNKIIAFDTETTSIDAFSAELVGISFAVEAHKAWYIPFPKEYETCIKLLQPLKAILENENIEKIGQNIKYDISVLKYYNIEVRGKLFDTMIMHYLIEPDHRHNMDYLAEVYLDYTPVSIEELIGKGRNQKSMRDVPVEQAKEYAAEDADITFQLYQVFQPMLKEKKLEKLFNDIEMPLVYVLSQMEANGVRIDTANLEQISKTLEKEIQAIETAIYKDAGTIFNIGSPKQLGEILFERLGIKIGAKKTKTGQYATGEDVLMKMVHVHPIIQQVLDYRSLTKLKSTYVDALPLLLNKRDGLIHTSYNQAVASTGRLSSNNPNLQNIPIRTERGREIRRAFVPRSEAYTLLAADYSQIELRIIAHLSGDKHMIEAFEQGLDIHAVTAARVYRTEIENVTSTMRRNAKMVNFGIIYGISAFGLAERLGISRSEASEIINNYFREYPGIKEYMNRSIAFAKEHQYVETMLGRRRYLRDINTSNSVVRGFAERNAINAPIQGTSADMIKIAMSRIAQDIEKQRMQSKMILQVHDELVFDAKKDELETLKAIVKQNMVEALPLSVPIVVDMNTGSNWLEAH